jgi:hypothetical protein
VLAIRAACGIEALVWLTDIGGLSREEAVEVMRGSAQALLRSAMAEAFAASQELRRGEDRRAAVYASAIPMCC